MELLLQRLEQGGLGDGKRMEGQVLERWGMMEITRCSASAVTSR